MRDWRKAADYSFPKKFPPSRWAWEFLRRNPDYRKDWEEALSRLSELESEDVSDVRIIVEMESDPDSRFGFRTSTTAAQIAAKWLLHGSLINPAVDEPPHLSFNPGFGSVRFMRSGVTFKARGLDFPVVEFNLHLPLAPQLEAIVETLENARKRMPVQRRFKNHPKLWPHYLRLLDADLDGRTAKQIADVLGKEVEEGMDEKKIWDQLEAAKKLRSPEGYQAIFLAPL